MDEIEYRFVKIDPPAGDSRILEGTVIRYGEIGVGDYGPERFTPGSLEVNPDIILNVQHDRGRPIARTPDTLQLVDSAEALTLRADDSGNQGRIGRFGIRPKEHPSRSIPGI